MKLKNYSIIFILIIILSVLLLSSCDDSGVVTTPPKKPDIQFKAGAVYYYRNDTISSNGTYNQTAWSTKDVVQAMMNYNDKDCFPVSSTTRDTVSMITIRSATDYYSYSQNEGIFYQWGARNLIDPVQPAQWDTVANFNIAIGTETYLYTITNLFSNNNLSAKVYSKIAADTTAPLVAVKCYRVSMRAEIFYTSLTLGSVYMDYYIGYNSSATNPSGRLGTKIYPTNVGIPGIYSIVKPGADQRLVSYFIP